MFVRFCSTSVIWTGAVLLLVKVMPPTVGKNLLLRLSVDSLVTSEAVIVVNELKDSKDSVIERRANFLRLDVKIVILFCFPIFYYPDVVFGSRESQLFLADRRLAAPAFLAAPASDVGQQQARSEPSGSSSPQPACPQPPEVRLEVGISRPADPVYLARWQIRKGGYGRKGSQGAA